MHVIEHPERFKDGSRVLVLKSRHKDRVGSERCILRVTHAVDQFNLAFSELVRMARPGERIYAAGGSRDVKKAMRRFKELQLASEYDDDPTRFYRTIEDRWVSALMAPTSQEEKLWLFDCDSLADADVAESELSHHYDRPMPAYRYASKSGVHIVVQPFDRTKLSEAVRSMIHENPIILWAY